MDTSLGPLKLNKDVIISKKALQELFPEFIITYEISSGDSDDFHYFKIFDKDSALLFIISSYLNMKNILIKKRIRRIFI